MSKTGVGFVGAGWMGATLMRSVAKREDAVILGLHQRSAERAWAVLTELGLPAEVYRQDYTAMIEDPEIDAVFICSSNEAHGPQALAAQAAGKHVFCEIPCAVDYDDYVAQIEWEEKNEGKVTFVNYLMDFDPFEERLRAMAREGVFGKIMQLQVNYRHAIELGGAMSWKRNRSRMGDALGLGIVHSLAVMIRLMAEQGAGPRAVYATNCAESERGFDAPPVWNIQVEFDSGATGICLGNVEGANGFDFYHNVHGTRGGLVFDPQLERPGMVRYWSAETAQGRWIHPLDRTRCGREGIADLAWPEDMPMPGGGDFLERGARRSVEHFLSCVHAGEQSPLGFRNSAKVAEVGWAAQMSAVRKERVNLPLDVEEARYFFYSQRQRSRQFLA